MPKVKVLFVCVHNAARSQMAEAFLNKHGGNRYRAESAGLEPGTLNPFVVEVMKEVGIDISDHPTRSVFDLFRGGGLFHTVITVCDETQAERCPVFPGVHRRLHWGFPDPASFTGSREEKLEQTRRVRDQIEKRIREWIDAT